MPTSATSEEADSVAGRNGSAAKASAQGFEGSLAELADAISELRVLADVGSERVRLRWRRTLARLYRQICFGAAMILVVSGGIVLVVIGLAGALRAAFAERPWLGELLAGAVLLAGALAWALARGAHFERAERRRLRAKFGDPEDGGQRSEEPKDTRPDRGAYRPG